MLCAKSEGIDSIHTHGYSGVSTMNLSLLAIEAIVLLCLGILL